MAGLAWSLTPGTIVDINYRFTWMGSAETTTSISNGTDTYSSQLKIGDSFDHQLRAGLRWNVW
jgi:opacity protein-like surface antigen